MSHHTCKRCYQYYDDCECDSEIIYQENTHLKQKCKELKEVLKDILKWKDSEPVQGAFVSAWVHGMVADEEFSKKAQEMFERAQELVKNDS